MKPRRQNSEVLHKTNSRSEASSGCEHCRLCKVAGERLKQTFTRVEGVNVVNVSCPDCRIEASGKANISLHAWPGPPLKKDRQKQPFELEMYRDMTPMCVVCQEGKKPESGPVNYRRKTVCACCAWRPQGIATTLLRLRKAIHPAIKSSDRKGCHDNSQTLKNLSLS